MRSRNELFKNSSRHLLSASLALSTSLPLASCAGIFLKHESEKVPELRLAPIKIVSDAHEQKQLADDVWVSKNDALRALQILQKALPDALKHRELRDAHDIMLSISRMQQVSNQIKESEQSALDLIAFDKKNFRENSSKLSDAYAHLGLVLQIQGKYAEAEAAFLKALAIREELGSCSAAVEYAGKLVYLCQLWQKPEKAEQYALKQLLLEESGHGSGSLALVDIHCTIARLSLQSKKESRAQKELKAALNVLNMGPLPQCQRAGLLLKIASVKTLVNKDEASSELLEIHRLLSGQERDPAYAGLSAELKQLEADFAEKQTNAKIKNKPG